MPFMITWVRSHLKTFDTYTAKSNIYIVVVIYHNYKSV